MSAMSDIYDGSVSFISRFLYLFGIRESQDERKRVDNDRENRALKIRAEILPNFECKTHSPCEVSHFKSKKVLKD